MINILYLYQNEEERDRIIHDMVLEFVDSCEGDIEDMTSNQVWGGRGGGGRRTLLDMICKIHQ